MACTIWKVAAWTALALTSSAGCGSDDEAMSDAGGGPIAAEDCFADLAAPEAGFVEVQRFRSEDGSLRVWRARQPGDRSAVGETFPYDLVRAWIETEDEPGACVTEARALAYTFGHHNWAEEWSMTTAHAKYIGREMFSNAPADPAEWTWTDTLEAQDDDGAPLFTVGLIEDGCETMPYDLNACMQRMRIDEPPPGWGEE